MGNHSETALLEAAAQGNVTNFQKALASGADPDCRDGSGKTVLALVAANRPDLVRRLLEAGADPGRPCADRTTPLHWAVEYDNTDAVLLLLAGGAYTEAIDNLAETPLHWAAWTGHHRSASLLLEAGANPDAKNCGGHTPADLVKKQGHEGMPF